MKDTTHNTNDADDEGSIHIGACSLCHCALDYSDRAAFFREDREEDYKQKSDDATSESSYFFGKEDPYLPESLWDANNALVYCDSCERMYHQKCHYVPIFSVPRGSWHCLYCVSQKQCLPANKPKKSKETNNGHKKRNKEPLLEFFKQLHAANISIPSSFEKDDNSKSPSVRDLLFVSPPIPEVAEWEKRWEAASRFLKASTWHGAFSQIRNAISGQLATHRLAQAGLQTWTSTSHNFHFFQNSQELHDTLIKMFGAQYRIRSWMLAIESCRSTWPGERMWQALLEWTKTYKKSHAEFVKRVIFPFGDKHPRRIEPKTPEYRLHREEAEQSVPDQINIYAAAETATKLTKKAQTAAKQTLTDKEKDDDSGITLDELVCCVCMENHATDENDLVLCDGRGCFRAYHQHCVKPAVSLSDNEDDWFCPLCSGQADLLHYVQSGYMGDEWEQRRIQRHLIAEEMKNSGKKRKNTEDIDDSSSLRSWADVNDVFPNAEADYPAAVMLRKGKKNAASNALVARVLGLDEDSNGQMEDGDDEIEEDEQFDLNSYQRKRMEERENARMASDNSSNDDTTDSSAATLVEMSSVELEIDRAELAALSDNENDDMDGHSKADGKSKNARGMRLRSKRVYNNAVGYTLGDIGKLDESNILDGKRGRAPVDYIVLNRSLFGDLSRDEAAEIDDGDDFVIKGTSTKSRSRDSESTSASSDENNSGSDSVSSKPVSNTYAGSSASKNSAVEKRPKRSQRPSCESSPSDDKGLSKRKMQKANAAMVDVHGNSEAHTSSQSTSMAKKAIHFVSSWVSGA